MMTVEPTCRYCYKIMDWRCMQIPTSISTGPYATETSNTYWCAKCKSEQDFSETGQPQRYSFHVGKYELGFCPKTQTFTIWLTQNSKLIIELNQIPDLTPQNTTEKRIETLITFS